MYNTEEPPGPPPHPCEQNENEQGVLVVQNVNKQEQYVKNTYLSVIHGVSCYRFLREIQSR